MARSIACGTLDRFASQELRFASSADGKVWEDYALNPVLQEATRSPSIVAHDSPTVGEGAASTYEMWYGTGGLSYATSMDWRDPVEALRPAEVAEILDCLTMSFRPQPLVYFQNTREAIEAAEEWDDTGFEVVFDSGVRVSLEPYTRGVGYGQVRILDEDGFDAANQTGQLSFRDVLVLSFAPRDIEGVVSGILTSDPQGELSHLSVRTGRRGTPNAFVRDAPELLADLSGALVRLEVTGNNYTIEEADIGEAEVFWESHRPTLSELPTLDAEFSALLILAEIGALDPMTGGLPNESRFGGKASNFARLQTILQEPPFEQYQERGFVIPVRYYVEFARSNRLPSALSAETLVTYEEYLVELETDPQFQSDSSYRFERLEVLRNHMEDESAVAPELVARLAARIDEVFGTTTSRVRFRSSSNVEDAVEFSGAGLYRSLSVCAADDLDEDDVGPSHCDPARSDERGIARGLRRVWASLWNFRVYEERAFFGIPQELAGMGVLVNRAFIDENSNGVAFTGNPTNAFDRRYVITAQIGEESVVSPAPGTLAEKNILDVQGGVFATATIRAIRSSLLPVGEFVLNDEQLLELGTLLWHMDQNFPLTTGTRRRDEILLDAEFKFEATGELAVKQVRGFLLQDSGPPLPTFELVVPAGTMACGTYDIAREPRDEYELKSTVRLKPGTIQLPSGAGSFGADLVEELVIGANRQVATPEGPCVFTTTRLASGNGEVICRFEYMQDFVLEDGGTVRFGMVQLSFRVRDEELMETVVVLDDVTLTDGVFLRGVLERDGTFEDLVYTSCKHTALPRWDIQAHLEDGTVLRFEERHRPELARDFGPTSLHRAEIEISGMACDTRITGTSSTRPNAQPSGGLLGGLGLCGGSCRAAGPGAVHRTACASPTDGLGATAAYLGPAFEVLATPVVTTFERREKGVVVEPPRFLRGDVIPDGQLDAADALSLLNYLFQHGTPPPCRKAAGASDNGKLHLSDAIAILLSLSGRPGPLAVPMGPCGEDLTADALDCVVPACH